MTLHALYEPLIERDLASIPAAVDRFLRDHSSDELFLAVARFAVLAYAPSQHAKHALLCCLAAHDLREEFGERWDGLLTECAAYVAASRQPWSEPPIMDPPAIDDDQRGDVAELLEAIEAGDRLRGERWLAKRFRDGDVERDLLRTAAADLSDLGHKLIIANAALRLVPILGEQGRFATLRVAVWEMTAYHEPVDEGEAAPALAPEGLVERLVDRLIDEMVVEKGSLTSAHAIFLLDAALECGDDAVLRRVCGQLAAQPANAAAAPELEPAPRTPYAYHLARDYGECLQMYAVAKRLAARFPRADTRAMLAAAHHNRIFGPSFEEWSFA